MKKSIILLACGILLLTLVSSGSRINAVVFASTTSIPTSTLVAGPFISQSSSSCPPENCTAGRDVSRDYFVQVVGLLDGVPVSDFAVDALVAWEPHENTSACWNPLATTRKMDVTCNFNSVGVQHYQNKDMGVQATAETLNLGYYDNIRKMLRLEAFDREGLRAALGTWGTCSGFGCDSLLNKWQNLWDTVKSDSVSAWTEQVVNVAQSYVLAEHHYVMGGHGQYGDANPYHYVTSNVDNYCHTYPNRGLCTQHRHFDCIGMVETAFEEAGFEDRLRLDNVDPWTVSYLFSHWQSNHPDQVHYDYNWSGRQPGDIVIVNNGGHVGILAEGDNVINAAGGYCHSSSGCGGSGVKYTPLSDFQSGFYAYLDVESNELPVDSAPPSTGHFPDVDINHPFFPYIEALYAIGAVSGFSDGTYRPDDAATRGAAAKIIILSLGQYEEYTDGQCAFNDVCPGDSFYHYIRRLKELGITSGDSSGNYNPADPLTRGALAKLIIRGLGEEPHYTDDLCVFTDVCSEDDTIFYHYIRRLKEIFVQKGIPLGYSDGTYRPDEPITRGGIAKLVIIGLDLEDSMPTFYDVLYDNIFYIYVEGIAERDITDGCGSSPPLFCHDDPLTRGQAAKFIIRGLGEEPNYDDDLCVFSDVCSENDTIFYHYIRRLKELNIASGFSDGTYKPDQGITRAEIAKLIVNALKVQNVTCQYNQDPGFNDVDPSDVFYPYVQCLKELEITSGFSDGTYRPEQSITRVEAAKFIYLAFVQHAPTVPQELSDSDNDNCNSSSPTYTDWEWYAVPSGDTDCIQFPILAAADANISAQASESYHIVTNYPGPNADIKIEVLASDGNTVLTSATGQGKNGGTSLSWLPSGAGTYYVRLSNTNPFATEGVQVYLTVEKQTLIFLPLILKNHSKISPTNSPPNTPTSPAPPDNATDQSIDANLSWSGGDPDGDTVTYDVYFEANDSAPDVLVSNDQSATTYDPGTLEADTHYYWQIVATDEHGATTTGPVWDFATASSSENQLPYTPSTPSPSDGATSQPITITLNWTGGDPDGDSLVYDVYLEANDSTPDVLVSNDQSSTSYSPDTLSLDTHYYWQVVASDEHGATAPGPVWDFETLPPSNQPPYTPSNPTPSDGATDQATNVDLSWSGGDPDGDTVVYDVYFEANDSTPDVLVSNDQSSTSYDPGTLSAGTHYYWQIVASDGLGAATSGPVWDFVTSSPPSAPSNLQAQALDATRIKLTWTDNSDNEDGFYIHNGYDPVATLSPNVTSYIVTGLESFTWYCHRIYAFNDAGDSDWTDWACDTTFYRYFDDFGDSSSGWPNDPAAGYSYQSGEFQITNSDDNSMYGVVLPTVGSIDYTVEADIRLYSGTPIRYGLIFDWLDWDNYYVFAVNPISQNWSLHRMQNGTWTTIDTADSSSINYGTATNHLEVQRLDQMLQLMVNGNIVKLCTSCGGAFTGDLRVGLSAKSGNDVPVTARFDDLLIEELR